MARQRGGVPMILSGFYYHASAGETFDSVALEVYGDEKFAAELLQANVEHAGKLIFSGGEALALPTLTVQTEEDSGEQIGTAPWKE